MTINDPQIRSLVDRVVAGFTGLPVAVRPVAALMDAYVTHSLKDGPDSPQVAEVLRLLLSEELRPALRQWYQYVGPDLNPAALEFRKRLSALAQEKL